MEQSFSILPFGSTRKCIQWQKSACLSSPSCPSLISTVATATPFKAIHSSCRFLSTPKLRRLGSSMRLRAAKLWPDLVLCTVASLPLTLLLPSPCTTAIPIAFYLRIICVKVYIMFCLYEFWFAFLAACLEASCPTKSLRSAYFALNGPSGLAAWINAPPGPGDKI